MPRIDPKSPLRLIRRRLAPHLAPGRPDVPLALMASACGLSPQTWRRGESESRSLNGASLARILRSLQALGWPLRPDHLLGYLPLPDVPLQAGGPRAAGDAVRTMLLAQLAPTDQDGPLTLDVAPTPSATPNVPAREGEPIAPANGVPPFIMPPVE